MSDEITFEIERLRIELEETKQKIVASNLALIAANMTGGNPTENRIHQAYDAYKYALQLVERDT